MSTITSPAISAIARQLLLAGGIAILGQPVIASEPASSKTAGGSARFSDRTLVLTADQLDNGHPRLSTALAALVPGFTSPTAANRGNSAHVQTLQDRGLSPDQVLVLVNGERRYKSAITHVTDTPAQGSLAVDLDAIPLAAVERVEITRANGSVLHGSAGAAGVINVILKQRANGGQLYGDFGQHSTEITDVADALGTRVINGEPVLGTAGDRNPDDGDGDTLRLGGSWGFRVGENGSLTAAASYLDRKRTTREGFSPGRLYPLDNGALDQREITTERLLQRFGDADTQELNFSAALEQAVHGMTFNMLFTYAARTAKSFAAYQRPVDLPSSLPTYPEGFVPEQTSDSDGLALTLQLRGNHFGWDWLATYHQGEDELDWSLQDSINLSLESASGEATPTAFLIGNNESRIQELSLKLSRDLSLSFAEHSHLLAGFDYQSAGHEIERGDTASRIAGGALDAAGQLLPAGSQQVIGIRERHEFDEGRASYAGFAELHNSWRDGAISTRFGARFTDYDDIDAQFDINAAASFRPNPKTLINVDISKGHRAPDMGQRFYNGTFVRYFDQTLTRVEILRNDDTALAAFGGKELEAETSLTANLSANYQFTDDFSVRAAASWLDIDDRVLLSEALAGAAVDALFVGRGIDAERLAFFTNGADSKTTSFDLGTSYRVNLPASHIDLDLDASIYSTNASANNITATQAVGRRVLQRLEQGGPETKVHMRANWQREKTGLELRATWFGSAVHPGDTAEADHNTGSGVLIDLSLEYQLNNTVTATLGGLNLLDAYPDVFEPDSTLTANPSEQPFSNYSPWGFNGRYVFLALRATVL